MDENRVIAAKAAPTGLTVAEARDRLRQFGPNRVEEERRHPLLAFFGKFWAPVPWMLEATIALEILVHKLDEAVIIFVLLLFNSLLSFVQENQANRALELSCATGSPCRRACCATAAGSSSRPNSLFPGM